MRQTGAEKRREDLEIRTEPGKLLVLQLVRAPTTLCHRANPVSGPYRLALLRRPQARREDLRLVSGHREAGETRPSTGRRGLVPSLSRSSNTIN